jgi:hypothetical protein
MKYDVIKTVAQNIGQSFVSPANSLADGCVMNHLIRAAAASRKSELRVNVLTGDAWPAALVVPPVRDSLDIYVLFLPGMLRDRDIRMASVREATPSVRLDLSRLNVTGPARQVRVPFECVVEITDDQGIIHLGTVRDGWSIDKPAVSSSPT